MIDIGSWVVMIDETPTDAVAPYVGKVLVIRSSGNFAIVEYLDANGELDRWSVSRYSLREV